MNKKKDLPVTHGELQEMIRALHGDDHDRARAYTAREAYVRWRMQDLPAIYVNLLPACAELSVLMEAEACIRAQIEVDLKKLAQPWRKVGERPSMNLFHWKPDLLAQAEAEVRIPVAGLTDAPRPGFEDHPEVLAAIEQAKDTPQARWNAECDRLNQAVEAAENALKEATEAGADQATLAALQNTRDQASRAFIIHFNNNQPK